MLITERARDHLSQIIKELQLRRFRRRAETLPGDQMLLGLEEVKLVVSGAEAEADAVNLAERGVAYVYAPDRKAERPIAHLSASAVVRVSR